MLKNITELLAEQKLESVWQKQDCCKCEKCKEDILAHALTRLPPHYISSASGELYARTKMLSAQYETAILCELVTAMEVVSKKPNHD